MIFGLPSDFDQAEGPAGVKGGVGQHFDEVRLAYMVGAGTRDKDAAGAKHLESAEVELFVATQGCLDILRLPLAKAGGSRTMVS